jgi:cell division protein FtsB
MGKKKDIPWVALLLAITGAALFAAIMALLATRGEKGKSSKCQKCTSVCKMHKELQGLRDENIDLRGKVASLEAKLEHKSNIEPDSRHFYDCKPSKKGEVWTAAIQSLTQGKIWTYYCMAHNGHTSPERQVPEEKRQKITCKDSHTGTRWPP